jgi:proteic killer suppression protein
VPSIRRPAVGTTRRKSPEGAGSSGGIVPLFTLDVINARRYYLPVIVSFKDRDTGRLAAGERVRRFARIESVARRKLRQLQIAGRLADLRVPPGNRLEALQGHRAGQHSIRVNDQFRVCFRWTAAGAEDVEIADYH